MREVTRLSSEPDQVRSFGRSVETIYYATAAGIAVAAVLAAPIAARWWLRADTTPESTVRTAVVLIGLGIAAQWPSSFYGAALLGLQRHDLANACPAIAATLRPLVVLAGLKFVSPTLTTFLVAQLLVGLFTTWLTRFVYHRQVGGTVSNPRWRMGAIRPVMHYAAGLTLSGIIGAVLTNMDRLILSKYASLAAVGCYSVAAAAAMLIPMITQPFFATAFPRFVHLIEARDEPQLRKEYRLLCQAVAVLVLPAALGGALFAHDLMSVYLQDQALAAKTAGVFSILAIGNACNALITIPYALQLANGRVQIVLIQNTLSAIVALPLLIYAVPRYGAIAAAAVWLGLNASYVIIQIPLVHAMFLRHETWPWLRGTAGPATAAALVFVAARYIALMQPSAFVRVSIAVAAGCLAVAAAAVAAPAARRAALAYTSSLRWRSGASRAGGR